MTLAGLWDVQAIADHSTQAGQMDHVKGCRQLVSATAWIAPAASCFIAVGAAAQTPAGPPVEPDSGLRGDYRKAGPALACEIAETAGVTRESLAKAGEQACLHIGPIALGMEIEAVEKLLGRPWQSQTRTNDEIRVYTLPAAATATSGEVPYIVVGIRSNRVVSVQLTGVGTAKPIAFSSITLSTPIADLVERLGQPHRKSPVVELASVNGELWSYVPWPVSFEIVYGRVYSIRISYENDGNGQVE